MQPLRFPTEGDKFDRPRCDHRVEVAVLVEISPYVMLLDEMTPGAVGSDGCDSVDCFDEIVHHRRPSRREQSTELTSGTHVDSL